MGSVAAVAGRSFHGIVSVGSFKCSFLHIMARHAQSRFLISQQVRLIGTVREMTFQTGFGFQRLMDDWLLEVFLFVALIADVREFGL